MGRRIGIYSGTFDPIHTGHLAFGRAAQSAGQLDEVVFIPEAVPRGKTLVTPLEHRAEMIRQATAPHTGLRTLTLESPQFTLADTLPELQRHFPDAELSLLIGSDVARTLAYRWEGLEHLAGARFIIGMRSDDKKEDIEDITQPIQLLHQIEFVFVPAEKATSHISSSRARGGDHTQLPTEVVAYIRQNNLYPASF